MCKEAFYISPFNNELTAAIIGLSLTPAILPGTWGVKGVTFFQNNKVHWDAGSAFQHPDSEPRWDISNTLRTPFHCSMHLTVTGTSLPCHQKLTAAPPVAARALCLTGRGEWMEQPTCSVAPQMWTRKKNRTLPGTSRTAEVDSSITFTLVLAKNLLSQNHCSIQREQSDCPAMYATAESPTSF